MDTATPDAAITEAVTTVEEATMAGAGTADMTAAAASALASGFTARPTPMDTATPPAIAARPATTISSAIGIPQAAPLIRATEYDLKMLAPLPMSDRWAKIQAAKVQSQ